MEDLVALNGLSIREFASGRVRMQWYRQDTRTGKLTYQDPLEIEQAASAPLTIPELALLAAAERVAEELGYEPELPW
jgi:hypothetical protein